ncbi:MAG: transcriptional regulator with XRE-family HTH domain [Paraglaciecola sp.]|jgi:transcriptional regulator with XRE-family HTH domain
MIYGPQQLANQLKLIRTNNNWTQAEIAKRVGVKQATISNFENEPDRCQLHALFFIRALSAPRSIKAEGVERRGLTQRKHF